MAAKFVMLGGCSSLQTLAINHNFVFKAKKIAPF